MHDNRLIVVAYDTPSNRRRRKLAKKLEDYGERRQKSVFECWLTSAQFRRLWVAMKEIIDEEEDSIRCYHLCVRCCEQVETMGTAEPPEDDPVYYSA